jgi:hypothetical protein
MPILDEADAKAYCVKPKFSEWKLIGVVVLVVIVLVCGLRSFKAETNVKLISRYLESVTIEQGKQKMTVDGLQMTQFVLSGVRVIVNGDTLRNVNCEMAKH